jgi:hypothetical protein
MRFEVRWDLHLCWCCSITCQVVNVRQDTYLSYVLSHTLGMAGGSTDAPKMVCDSDCATQTPKEPAKLMDLARDLSEEALAGHIHLESALLAESLESVAERHSEQGFGVSDVMQSTPSCFCH